MKDGQKAYLLRAKINGLAGLGKYQGDGKAAGAAGESLFVANHQYWTGTALKIQTDKKKIVTNSIIFTIWTK